MFTHLADDGALWASLIEKAFAKYWGNYGHIAGGDSVMAVRTLMGTPYEYMRHTAKPTDADYAQKIDELWKWLLEHANGDSICNCGTHGNDDTKKDESGIVQGHAYTLLKAVELSNGVKLVQARNPWGRDSYHGDWSDNSDKWTPALAAEAGFVKDREDGTIFMELHDYYRMFEYS